jgi:hypothetical protein
MRTLDEAQALEILGRSITPERVRELSTLREFVRDCTSRKELKESLVVWRQNVAKTRTEGRVLASQQQLIGFFHYCATLGPGQIVYARKALLTTMLPHYDSMPFPHHAQIGIDPEGRGSRANVVRTLESTLFEDMCALFNLAWAYRDKGAKESEARPNKERKTAFALFRATISAAFYFVESYINGLAFHYLASPGSPIDQKTEDYLSEWDSVRNRPKFIRMRDKLLQYPRVVLGLDHPPLQENNCAELAFIVTKAKQLRDSIVHASPISSPESLLPEKEEAVYSLRFADVEETVDNAIGLVSKIEAVVHGNLEFVTWLRRRGPDGLFSEEVFD